MIMSKLKRIPQMRFRLGHEGSCSHIGEQDVSAVQGVQRFMHARKWQPVHLELDVHIQVITVFQAEFFNAAERERI